jgi:hypothetical protein
MWRMNDGDRCLTGPEWGLFGTGVELLWGYIEADIRNETDDAEVGVPVFDRLTPEQKLSLLAEVADALRDPAISTPEHTAANEGAIDAVFAMIRIALETELGYEGSKVSPKDPTEIRRMLRAVGEVVEEKDEPLPEESSTDADAWDWLVEEFEGRIFWDADFEMGDEFLDLPPNEAREGMELLRIDADYYLSSPAEPDQDGLEAARQKLAHLLGLPARPEG